MKEKGITLIALSITIVVIFILAGVTIDTVFSENGIINKAKEAAEAMNQSMLKEEKELDQLLEELNSIMESNDEWNPSTPGINNEVTGNEEIGDNEETDGNAIGELFDNNTIEVGDYVSYEPEGMESYVVSGTYSGTGADQTITKETLNWRVLDKTKDGKVRIISDGETKSTVKLQGANGYNNCVYLLDELCNTLYKSSNSSAKNLKVEDIQDKMNLTVWNYNNYEGYGRTYNPTNKEYPIILSESSGQIVNGREGSLGISEQNTLILGTAIASSWTVKQTLWTAELNVNNYIDPMYHQLFHARITKPCWLSSRSERPWGNDWYYDTFLITPTQIAMGGHMAYSNASYIYTSGGISSDHTHSYRPVVTLEKNVIVDTSVVGTNGLTPETAWIIK